MFAREVFTNPLIKAVANMVINIKATSTSISVMPDTDDLRKHAADRPSLFLFGFSGILMLS